MKILNDRRLALAMATLYATHAEASAFVTPYGGIPWISPLDSLLLDMADPILVGFWVVLAIAAASLLVYHDKEISGIAKGGLYVVLGLAMIVFINKFLFMLGLQGAMI